MTMLEIQLLGEPSIALDGRPIALYRRDSIALLAFLVLSGRTRPRAFLKHLLIPESYAYNPDKYLSNLATDLRHNLGSYLISTRSTLAFDRRLAHRVDVTEFQACATQILDGASRSTLAQLATLYRGELLEGLALNSPHFESWRRALSDDLREQWIQGLQAAVRAGIASGDRRMSAVAARRLVAEDPWRVDTIQLVGRLRAVTQATPHNLAEPAMPLIGRTSEMRQLRDLLSDGACHLLTIAGLSGTGKTRLAVQVAHESAASNELTQHAFPDGIYVADCRDANRPLASRIAGAIGLPLAGNSADVRERLMDWLKSRTVLLVLDDVEDAAPTASVLGELCRQSPGVRIVVTATAPLQVEGEHVMYLNGLDLPANAADLETADASALFLQEARRIDSQYVLVRDEREALVRLCEAIGGYPLGMVLAARSAVASSCSAVAADVARGRLEVLSTSDTDLPQRHRNVRDLLERVLAQLTREERQLVAAIAAAQAGDRSPHHAAPSLAARPEIRTLYRRSIVHLDGHHGVLRTEPVVRALLQREGTPELARRL